jgi:hypothetical protein
MDGCIIMVELTKKEKKKVFERILKRFQDVDDATNEIRTDALDDIRFSTVQQWDDIILKERKGRPCLTIDKLDGSIKQVCNEHRQNRAAIKFRAFDNAEDPLKAEIANGVARHIMNNKNSSYARDMAFDQAVRGGFGFFRVITDYVGKDSFDQDIYVKSIKNPLSVYFPLHLINEPDYSDAPYAFIRSKISKDEYKISFPDDDIKSWDKAALGDYDQWMTEDSVYIIEYFEKSEEKKTIYLISDGQNKQVVDSIEMFKEDIQSGNIQLLDQRETTENKIMWYKASGGGILDSREWAGKYIPIIPVTGQEVNVEGRIYLFSLTRKAKDPCRMLNYWKSLETEMIALQPKVPYIGAAGQFENHPEWKTANQKNHPYLEYEPVSSGGQLAPPPQRVGTIGIDTGIVNAIKESADDIKGTTGIFDASLGARGNETSGRAINARTRQGQTANYHFTDSSILATQYLGKILLDLFPKIYDTARVLRILGDDMKEKVVNIPDNFFDDMERYDVVVDTGPDYATKRTEIVETLTMLNTSSPVFAELTGDYIAQNLDIDGAQALSERMQRFLEQKYPGLISGDTGGMSEEEVKQIVADLQKLQMQLQEAGMINQQLQQIIKQLQQQVNDKQADRDNKIEITQIKAAADIDKAKITAQPAIVKNTLETVEHMHDYEMRKKEIESAPAPSAEKKT